MFCGFKRIAVIATLVCGLLGVGSASATSTPTITFKLTLVSLPSTITLCRDPNAIATFGVDAQWQIAINVDNNPNTGDVNGADVVVLAETTPPQSLPCTAHSATTADNLLAGVLVWDAGQQIFVDSGTTATVVIDSTAGTLAITTNLIGALAGLTGSSPISVVGAAPYTPTSAPATYAYDIAATTVASAKGDSGGDIQACTAPCTQSATWIQIIDLINVETATSAPLATFGRNTLTVEFDLASLPSNITLCRYPALFTTSQTDYAWLTGFDLDNNANTGQGGIDVLIEAYTTPQAAGCSSNAQPIDQALTADLLAWDDNLQQFVYVSDLPFTVDAANGRITIQADRSVVALAGLGSASKIGQQTYGLYSTGNPPFAYDLSPPMTLDVPYGEFNHDVLNCDSPCAFAVDWYPQIDLLGGSVSLPAAIFSSGFE